MKIILAFLLCSIALNSGPKLNQVMAIGACVASSADFATTAVGASRGAVELNSRELRK